MGVAAPEQAEVFTLEIEQAALVNWDLERRAMIVGKWSPGRGVRETTRAYA